MNARLLRIALASLAAVAVAAGIAWFQVRVATQVAHEGTAAVGGPFHLTDHTGRAVSDADYRGRWMLIYFGYTFCPDVCPTELSVVAQVMDRLGPLADKVQPLFVTIDPERDTVAQMAGYVDLFHPRLVGLTGSPEQIADAARAFRVYYAKVPLEGGDAGDYTMDHSSFLYLMGPDGRFRTVYPGGTGPDAIAADLKTRLAS